MTETADATRKSLRRRLARRAGFPWDDHGDGQVIVSGLDGLPKLFLHEWPLDLTEAVALCVKTYTAFALHYRPENYPGTQWYAIAHRPGQVPVTSSSVRAADAVAEAFLWATDHLEEGDPEND